MNSIADAIQQFFAGAADSLTPFLAALSLIGIATMAIIQTIKDLSPLSRWFQLLMLRRWMRQGQAEAETNLRTAFPAFRIEHVDPGQALRQLVRLSVDGDDEALLSLSSEQMCGQMNSAVQVALDYPGRYPDLLLITASNADAADIALLATSDRAGSAEGEVSDPTPRIGLADARNRVTHQIQRAIDGFQIRVAYRWKWLLQLISFGISVLLSAFALAQWDATRGVSKFVAIVMTALAAGFLAPVARDLTAALQKFRR